MRRLSLVYVFIPAILLAAASLAYYGYSYSQRLAMRERQAILGTMAELAKEKLIGIQTAIADADRMVLETVDFNDFNELGEVLKSTPHRSAVVLDAEGQVASGGSFRKRHHLSDEDFFELLTERVAKDLELDTLRRAQTRYLQRAYDGHLYLFSATRVLRQGRVYHLILEGDISYLLAEVFPAFFDVRSPNLYQVVNEHGRLVYGYAFSGIPAKDVVEIGFPETLTLWRLRVAQRDAGSLASDVDREKTLDFVLIVVAMSVIAAGLLIMAVAVRRERRLSELKSDFISNVSHELKTPLSIISMFGELLAMGRVKSPEQAVEYAEIIRRESNRLSALIDNVLDFAKMERASQPYSFAEDQDLVEVVERALEICRPRLDRADMELHYESCSEIPGCRLDANALVLAILNLVDNAIKYASEGKRLDISICELEGEGRAEIRVRDYGPGIAKEEASSVFERFYRAKDIRLKPVRGSGIGLALVKNIAEAHKGGVSIDPEVEPGCAFVLWIPVRGAK